MLKQQYEEYLGGSCLEVESTNIIFSKFSRSSTSNEDSQMHIGFPFYRQFHRLKGKDANLLVIGYALFESLLYSSTSVYVLDLLFHSMLSKKRPGSPFLYMPILSYFKERSERVSNFSSFLKQIKGSSDAIYQFAEECDQNIERIEDIIMIMKYFLISLASLDQDAIPSSLHDEINQVKEAFARNQPLETETLANLVANFFHIDIKIISADTNLWKEFSPFSGVMIPTVLYLYINKDIKILYSLEQSSEVIHNHSGTESASEKYLKLLSSAYQSKVVLENISSSSTVGLDEVSRRLEEELREERETIQTLLHLIISHFKLMFSVNKKMKKEYFISELDTQIQSLLNLSIPNSDEEIRKILKTIINTLHHIEKMEGANENLCQGFGFSKEKNPTAFKAKETTIILEDEVDLKEISRGRCVICKYEKERLVDKFEYCEHSDLKYCYPCLNKYFLKNNNTCPHCEGPVSRAEKKRVFEIANSMSGSISVKKPERLIDIAESIMVRICSKCKDPTTIVLECGHFLCLKCILEQVSNSVVQKKGNVANCPLCQNEISSSIIQSAKSSKSP